MRYVDKDWTVHVRYRRVVTPSNGPAVVRHDQVADEYHLHRMYNTSKQELRSHILTNGCYPFNFAQSGVEGEWKGVGVITSPTGTRDELNNGPITTFVPEPAFPNGLQDRLLSDALADAYDKAANYRNEWQAGVDVGEMRQTKDMMQKRIPKLIGAAARAVTPWGAVAAAADAAHAIARTMARDLKAYKARNAPPRRARGASRPGKRRRSEVADTAANWWLEARLGWTPLLGSLDLMLRELATNRTDRYVHQFVGKARYSDTKTWSGHINELNDPADWKFPASEECKLQAEAKAFVTIAFTQFRKGEWMGSPFDVAWELVPLSFVVDRFYDIGAFLKREAALAGSRIVQVGKTYETKVLRSVLVSPTHPTAPGYTGQGQFAKLSESYVRSLWENPPSHVGPVSKGLKSLENVKHLLDYAALLRQLSR